MKSIDYEEIENLPYRERLWEKDGYKRYHYRYPIKLKQAQKIFKGSVGRDMSAIQKRLKPYLKSGNESFYKYTRFYLYEELRSWYRRYEPDFYVDENNILRSNIIIKPRRKQPLTWQQHYKLKQDRKKRFKSRKKEGLVQLTMINKPELFKFYNEILREYKSLVNNLKERERNLSKTKSKWEINNKINWNSYMYKQALKTVPKIETLKYQIEQLESGNFDIFFESNIYLYSLQKECHHFEQP